MRKLVLLLAAAAVAAVTGPAHAAHHTTLKINGFCDGGSRFTVSMNIDPVKDTVKLKYTVKNAPAGAITSCGYACAQGAVPPVELDCPDEIDSKGKLKFSTEIPAETCGGLVPFIFVGPETCRADIP